MEKNNRNNILILLAILVLALLAALGYWRQKMAMYTMHREYQKTIVNMSRSQHLLWNQFKDLKEKCPSSADKQLKK